MSPVDVKKYFADVASVSDSVERSQAVADFCCDAEQCLSRGDEITAVQMFELLTTLDRTDDLLAHYIKTAEEQLIGIGARATPAVETAIRRTLDRFGKLPDYERNMAVAKTLHRDMPANSGAIARARQFVAAAETVRALSPKDQRFKAELESQTGPS